MSDYNWVTDDLFDKALNDILNTYTGEMLLTIPGAYEVFSEYFNNDVLNRLDKER